MLKYFKGIPIGVSIFSLCTSVIIIYTFNIMFSSAFIQAEQEREQERKTEKVELYLGENIDADEVKKHLLKSGFKGEIVYETKSKNYQQMVDALENRDFLKIFENNGTDLVHGSFIIVLEQPLTDVRRVDEVMSLGFFQSRIHFFE